MHTTITINGTRHSIYPIALGLAMEAINSIEVIITEKQDDTEAPSMYDIAGTPYYIEAYTSLIAGEWQVHSISLYSEGGIHLQIIDHPLLKNKIQLYLDDMLADQNHFRLDAEDDEEQHQANQRYNYLEELAMENYYETKYA